MEKQIGKLTTKDVIAGAFVVLYVALLFVVVSATGFIPIVYIFAPLVLSVALGTYICCMPQKFPSVGLL